MASPQPPRTPPATTHRILRLTILRLHITAVAMRAALGQRDGDLLVDARRNGTARLLTVLLAGPTTWPKTWRLGVGFCFPREYGAA
jgi:hypothetical protein